MKKIITVAVVALSLGAGITSANAVNIFPGYSAEVQQADAG